MISYHRWAGLGSIISWVGYHTVTYIKVCCQGVYVIPRFLLKKKEKKKKKKNHVYIYNYGVIKRSMYV